MKHTFLSSFKKTFFKRAFILSLFLLSISGNIHSQWTQQVSGTSYDLLAIHFLNASTGFLASNSNNIPEIIGGEIIRTTNGGANWQRVLLDSNFRAKDFYFFNDNTGIAVGGSYTLRGYVFKTSNAGINWTDITQVNFPPYLINVVFPNNTTGFAGSPHGIFKTTDSGNNWFELMNLPLTYPTWGKVYFFDINTGVYCRDSANVYKTTNSGLNWMQLTVSQFDIYRDIQFVDNNTGFICGDSARIYRTTNQGLTWSVINPGINRRIFSMDFENIAVGYASADQYTLKTTNGGLNWFPVFNFSNQTLFAVHFINENTGYIAGDTGIVYKTTTGGVIGINPISTEVPKDFSLQQNYPNPFNPTTNIRFAVPKASNVKLTVFDMLGREVEVLVNENISPGIYEVKWDAARFSSGIYFYRIVTSNFTDVKKMSVIK